MGLRPTALGFRTWSLRLYRARVLLLGTHRGGLGLAAVIEVHFSVWQPVGSPEVLGVLQLRGVKLGFCEFVITAEITLKKQKC